MNEGTIGFLHHCWDMIESWDTTDGRTSQRERLEGLAFSILAALDDVALNCDSPAADDMGGLHDAFYEVRRMRGEKKAGGRVTVYDEAPPIPDIADRPHPHGAGDLRNAHLILPTQHHGRHRA